jgi:hypothetical protein
MCIKTKYKLNISIHYKGAVYISMFNMIRLDVFVT